MMASACTHLHHAYHLPATLPAPLPHICISTEPLVHPLPQMHEAQLQPGSMQPALMDAVTRTATQLEAMIQTMEANTALLATPAPPRTSMGRRLSLPAYLSGVG